MSVQVVLLSGQQGSGKSTTALAIQTEAKRFNYTGVFTAKFADPIYLLHEFILNKMEGLSGRPRVTKDGVLLQLLGTEWGRTVFGTNVWVDIMKKKISQFEHRQTPHNYLLIIDDCRFENEFDGFPDALRVRLQAPEDIRKLRTTAWRHNTGHPSETALDGYEKQGMFDMYFNTAAPGESPEHCATLIIAQLQKNSWKEKR